ncbi:MAG TPA: sigma-70 family RNA polymerase sigma factor [bacterium]|nr:sigma-70 family RNA polymerase sigma factor [bacterium]
MPAERPRWGWRREVHAGRGAGEPRDPSDEDLMRLLAAGRQDALGPLYGRYASRIFSLAAQTVDRVSAEEIVQDVFLAVWRKAGTFSPERGAFRPWVFQIAHFRILNELRRRSRQPRLDEDPDGQRLAQVPDPAPEPGEVVRREAERAIVRDALEALPPTQRQAVDLAFFENLTHEQVAAELRLPLGTAKTRIRAGLQKLRAGLSPAVTALVVGALGLGTLLGIRVHDDQVARGRDARALALLTSSETVAVRLEPAPGVPARTHAVYRGQAGVGIAVLTFEEFAPPPAGETYQAWVRHGDRWTSLGTARLDAGGDARLIVEGPELAVPPDAIEVTREPAGGRRAPSGSVVVSAPHGR